MKSKRNEIFQSLLFVLTVFGLLALFEVNLRLLPPPKFPTDFLIGWAGTRWFIYNGWSPYDQKTTQGINEMAYGGDSLPDERPGVFLFPFYSVFLFSPFALVKDFKVASALWLTVSQFLILATLILSVRLSVWRPSKWLWGGLLLFVFTWYHTLRPMIRLDYSLFSAFFLVLTLWMIHKRHDGLAGLLLVFAGFEPVMSLLPWVLITLWGISQKRWVLVLSPIIAVGLLSAAAAIFMPNWIVAYVRQNIYAILTLPHPSPGEILAQWLPGVGIQIGWVLTVVAVTLLIVEGYALWGKDLRRLVWSVFLSFILLPLIGIHVDIEGYYLMLPAICLVLSVWHQRWGRLAPWLMGIFLLLLSVGVWALVLDLARRSISPDVDARLVLFCPLLVLMGMIWVRWYAIRPAKLPLEILSERLG